MTEAIARERLHSDAESEYRITWTIDVSARSPEEAARKAREIQLRQDSVADVFEVQSGSETHHVDLSELDGRHVD